MIGEPDVISGIDVYQGAPGPQATDGGLDGFTNADEIVLGPVSAGDFPVPGEFADGRVAEIVTVGERSDVAIAVHASNADLPDVRCVLLTPTGTVDDQEWVSGCGDGPVAISGAVGFWIVWPALPAQTAIVTVESAVGVSRYQRPVARTAAFNGAFGTANGLWMVAYDNNGVELDRRDVASSTPATSAGPSTLTPGSTGFPTWRVMSIQRPRSRRLWTSSESTHVQTGVAGRVSFSFSTRTYRTALLNSSKTRRLRSRLVSAIRPKPRTISPAASPYVGRRTRSHPPGNRTVDIFVPSDWFDPHATIDAPIVSDRDAVDPSKIVTCEPRNGVVQVPVLGSASGRTEDVDVRANANTIIVDITPDPAGRSVDG